MAQIIFTKSVKTGVDEADIGTHPQATERKVTIFRSEGKVACATSSKMVAAPRNDSDKRYSRWVTTSSFGFRRTSRDTIVPFQCSRPDTSKRNGPWAHQRPVGPFIVLRSHDSEQEEAFFDAVWEEFNITKEEDVFPMMEAYDIPFAALPGNLSMAFRQEDWEAFAAVAFGKTRLSPRLVKAVQNTDPFFVACARNFRGLVDDSDLIGFMERNRFDEEMESTFHPFTPDFRKVLVHAPESVVKGLINAPITSEDMANIRAASHHAKHFIRGFQRKKDIKVNQSVTWRNLRVLYRVGNGGGSVL